MYREGVFPWGAQGTFLAMMAVVFGTVLVVKKFLGMERVPFVAVPGFLLLLGASIAWNELVSSFQRSREVLSSYRVGISMLFFNATSPLCKILIYPDGVELRLQFTRYFLPYEKCTEPPKLEGMFSNTLVLRTRIPDVPQTIRIRTGHASKILAEIEKARVG